MNKVIWNLTPHRMKWKNHLDFRITNWQRRVTCIEQHRQHHSFVVLLEDKSSSLYTHTSSMDIFAFVSATDVRPKVDRSSLLELSSLSLYTDDSSSVRGWTRDRLCSRSFRLQLGCVVCIPTPEKWKYSAIGHRRMLIQEYGLLKASSIFRK
jgi:hypothetical protein